MKHIITLLLVLAATGAGATSLSDRLLGLDRTKSPSSQAGSVGGNTLDRIKQSRSVSSASNTLFTKAVRLYQDGNFSEALPIFLQLDKQGNGQASFNAGILLSRGEGTQTNLVQAFSLFRRSAQRGFMNGMYLTGVYYISGSGVAANIDKGIWWLDRAFQRGHEGAKQALAQLVAATPHHPKFRNKRYQSLVKEAANSNNPVALNTLGYQSLYGVQGKPDVKAAMNYFQRAVETSYPLMDTYQALGFLRGEVDEQALDYFRKAASLGNAYSLIVLGNSELYQHNRKRDAMRFYLVASSFGSYRASKMAEMLGRILDDIEQEEATKEAEQLRDEILTTREERQREIQDRNKES